MRIVVHFKAELLDSFELKNPSVKIKTLAWMCGNLERILRHCHFTDPYNNASRSSPNYHTSMLKQFLQSLKTYTHFLIYTKVIYEKVVLDCSRI